MVRSAPIAELVEFAGTDRFQVLRRIGAGGMGIVYEVLDLERNVRVALKVLRTYDADALLRFKNEFRALQDLRHPHLIELGELFEYAGQWFFTMELIDGENFLSWVQAGGEARAQESGSEEGSTTPRPTSSGTGNVSGRQALAPGRGSSSARTRLDETRLRAGLGQLALGLHALHVMGKVHRDIKPSNILVTREGRVVLLDFGLISDVHGDTPGELSRRVGSISHMAPEQAGAQPVGPEADWYSVGVLLYQALTGTLPFSGAPEEVLRFKQMMQPVPPRLLSPELPSDLSRLCMELLRLDPRARPSESNILFRLNVRDESGPIGAGGPRFLGRQEELGALRAAFAEVLGARSDRQGEPRALTVLVHGESGVGKTALVRRFTELLMTERPETLVCLGRCHEREAVPYRALDGVIDAVSRHLSAQPPEVAAGVLPRDAGLLAQVFPVIRRVAAVAQAPRLLLGQLDPQERRPRVFTAMRELFGRLAGRHPVVLVIDDLQWADADGLALLGEVMRPPRSQAILLVATVCTAAQAMSRPRPQPQPLRRSHASMGPDAGEARGERRPEGLRGSMRVSGALEDDGGDGSAAPEQDLRNVATLARLLPGEIRELEVTGLPPAEAEALARRILSSTGTPVALSASAIASEAAGHPLFINELVRSRLAVETEPFPGDGPGAAESGRGGRAGEGRQGVGGSGEEEHPLRLEDALWARIRRLPRPSREVLEILAVAGAPLMQETVAQAAGSDFGAFAEQVAQLRGEHLVRMTGPRRTDLIEPYHDRVREAVLGHLDGEMRKVWHQRLALALEASRRADAEALAIHWREEGDFARAAMYAGRAADEASGVLAFDRAARLYQMALELQPPDAPGRHALEAKLGEALANAGRGAVAARAYLVAAGQAPAAMALDLRRRAAEQLLRSGHIDEGLEALGQVLRAVGLHLPRTAGRALAGLLWRRFLVWLRGIRFRACDASRLDPAALVRMDVCWSAGATLGLVDYIRASYFQTRFLLFALGAGEPHRIARGLAGEACFAAVGGVRGHRRATRLISAAVELANQLGNPYALGWAAAASGITAVLEGRWKVGLERCRQAGRIFRDECTGMAWERATVELFTNVSLTYLGRIGELIERVPEQLHEAEERGDLYAATSLSVGLANLAWLAAGRVEEARERQQAGIERWSRKSFHVEHWWDLLAQVHIGLYVGEGESMRRLVEEKWRQLDKALLLRVQLTRTEAYYLRGRVQLAAVLERRGAPGIKSAQGTPSAKVAKEEHALLRAVERDARRIVAERMPWSQPLGDALWAGVATVRGERERAQALWARAALGFAAVDMALHAAVARYRQGEATGGDEGEGLRCEAEEWMRRQGIAEPERMAQMIAPAAR
jgi:tetratricopeptide (TPR) repeat protein